MVLKNTLLGRFLPGDVDWTGSLVVNHCGDTGTAGTVFWNETTNWTLGSFSFAVRTNVNCFGEGGKSGGWTWSKFQNYDWMAHYRVSDQLSVWLAHDTPESSDEEESGKGEEIVPTTGGAGFFNGFPPKIGPLTASLLYSTEQWNLGLELGAENAGTGPFTVGVGAEENETGNKFASQFSDGELSFSAEMTKTYGDSVEVTNQVRFPSVMKLMSGYKNFGAW